MVTFTEPGTLSGFTVESSLPMMIGMPWLRCLVLGLSDDEFGRRQSVRRALGIASGVQAGVPDHGLGRGNTSNSECYDQESRCLPRMTRFLLT